MSEEKNIKILCVEDEQDIRENIVEILRDEGFEVLEASSGRSGFEVFVNDNPDLIISDIMMPELDGYGLLKLVRENKNTRNSAIPFIFLTALGQKSDVIKGVSMLANDYLIKPIDFDLMIVKVKEKAANIIKLKEAQRRAISNLKNQVSNIIPSEALSYIDLIAKISANLKQEPYGPLPHRHYLEDFEKIYLNSIKLRSSIGNAFDNLSVENKFNAEEEIFDILNFITNFIGALGEKFKARIRLDKNFEELSLLVVRLDSAVFSDALRKILVGIFKIEFDGELNIKVMKDHLDQVAVIFYLQSISRNQILNNEDSSQISKILDKQNCRFEIVDGRENTAILLIPDYRLVK
jgi:CheY-like chemotaxis protein